MPLPPLFLESVQNLPGFDREAFVRVHAEPGILTSLRLNPLRWQGQPAPSAIEFAPGQVLPLEPVPWASNGYYLPKRPSFTFDPLFHAGSYYVQEASSMFLEQALTQLADLSAPLRVLDLSAAPGGKSTHLQSLLAPGSVLVANEVIRPRALTLMDNLVRWGSSNVLVTNTDPSAFGRLPGFFDVVVVDAPCSGSGLFRKDPEAVNEWSPQNVALCSQRQQRILADVLPALKEGGLLVYATCSYSEEEDEAIGDWLLRDFSLQALFIQHPAEWGIVETRGKGGATGYRFYPDKLRGEGFFLAAFRKTGSEAEARLRPQRLEKATAKERSSLQPWMDLSGVEIIREGDQYYALTAPALEALALLQPYLKLLYKGTKLGAIMKDRLVPDHALALSGLLLPEVTDTPLDYRTAISYLQRQELDARPARRGWQTVSYRDHRLGWINALGNRINNYYPKEIRILKQQSDAGL